MTSLHWTILVLLLAIGALLMACVRLADLADERRERDGAQPMPTARQLRRWRRDRLQVPRPNRRRA